MALIDEATWHNGPPPEPRPNRRASIWDPVVAQVKARPGKSAEFKDRPRSLASWLRGRYPDVVIRTSDHHVDDEGRKRCTIWFSVPGPAGEG